MNKEEKLEVNNDKVNEECGAGAKGTTAGGAKTETDGGAETGNKEPEVTMNERFRYMRTNILHLSLTKLAEIVGLDYRNIGDIETGRTKRLAPDMCCILVKKFGINMNWLLCGEGEATKKETEDTFIHKFKTDLTVPVPFYDVKASAGLGIMLDDYVNEDVLFFDERWLKNILGVNPNSISLITAKGDSMLTGKNQKEDINDRDLLLIDNSVREIINNKIFVIRLDNDLLVKKVFKDFSGEVSLISNNPKYEPIKLTPFHDSEIIGRVVWNGNKETI